MSFASQLPNCEGAYLPVLTRKEVQAIPLLIQVIAPRV